MKLPLLGAGVLFLSGCQFIGDVAKLQQADFYQVGEARTLVVCVTGTGPPAGGVFVGSGLTSITPANC